MRRTGLVILANVALSGCGHLSVGLWSDSDRGAASVASITTIEFPAEPSMSRKSTPAVEPKKSPTSPEDEWEVPEHSKPTVEVAVAAKIPSAVKPLKEQSPPEPLPPKNTTDPSVSESWTPRIPEGVKSAEFAADSKDYRWIQGRVAYVKISGTRVWKIRFAPYDQVDRYGGSFVLEGTMPPNLKEGDLIRAEGRPLSDGTESRVARYRCDRLTILQRGEQSAQ